VSFVVKSKPKTVEEIFHKVEPQQQEIAEKLRSLIKDTLPAASEIVRQGKLSYVFNGKDFAAIQLAKSHVDLLFYEGDRLSSPMLWGTGSVGKSHHIESATADWRHIEVKSLKNFDQTEVVRLLKEAATIAAQL